MRTFAAVLRFLLWLIVATWLGRKIFGWLFGGQASEPQRQAGGTVGRRLLHRDPVCGTHVSSEISHTLMVEGVTHHFCSADCREKFRQTLPAGSATGRHAASA